MTGTYSDLISQMREELLAGSNRTCFIERETLLGEFDKIAEEYPGERRYAAAFSHLLDGLSTPVDPRERLVSRMMEDLPAAEDEMPEEIRWHDYINWNILAGPGHMTPDYEAVFSLGLAGILDRAEATAQRLGTARARLFAENARICSDAVSRFARRYAEAAAKVGNAAAADALTRVPFEPARNFFEAMQACWFMHFLLSCCIGGRDYGFGRMDQYLLSFYEADIQSGRLTRDDAVEIVADFCLKTNVIAGTGCAHYYTKPVPCQSSKQYVILGGVSEDGHDMANELSFVFLDAARRVKLTEPVLNVRIHPQVPSPLKLEAAKASIDLQGQLQFSNDRLIPQSLMRKGILPEDAHAYTANGCSRIDAGATHSCNEHYLCAVPWLLNALGYDAQSRSFSPASFTDFDALVDGLRRASADSIQHQVERWLAESEPVYECGFTNDGGEHFHFESLFVKDCVEKGLNTCQGGPRYVFHTAWFAGIATIADTLMTIRRLVFEEKRFTLQELLDVTAVNYEGHEDLRSEILALPKYGNDQAEVDAIAARVGNMLLDILDAVPTEEGTILYGSFYSLMGHQHQGRRLPATLDGRLAGEPISENQSPSYGADRKGITAVLKSVASLPFERACSGTLNLRFNRNIEPAKLSALVDAYFGMGGAILGTSFVERKTLEEAMAHPERHQTLYVRMYGFCEYFNAIPKNEQLELINRTEH